MGIPPKRMEITMNNDDKDDCLTCEHVEEHGHKALICIHPDLYMKHKNREIMIGKKGHPSWCPVAKNFNKAWQQWRNE